LDQEEPAWTKAPTIQAEVKYEAWQRRGASAIEGLTSRTLREIEEAASLNTPVLIVHAIKGERGSLACRDCGWTAVCESCGANLSLVEGRGLCRKCGNKSLIPEACVSCGGVDLSRGRPGKDRLRDQIFKSAELSSFHDRVQLIDLGELNRIKIANQTLIVVTDMSLMGGLSEDIRRRERLIIAWRRLAAEAARTNSRLIVQGPDELLQECPAWLTTEGLVSAWQREIQERKSFGFPPAVRLVKLIVNGNEKAANEIMDDLSKKLPPAAVIRGPYPVPFRPSSRTPRQILQIVFDKETSEAELNKALTPYKSKAIIDLDPIAFFC
jgi:primosomal protein N'